jgi:hypothetical protein
MGISIEDIQNIEKNKKQIKKQIYKKIYDQFTKKIKTGVELGHKQIILRIPQFLVGFPTYDLKKAGDYIQRQFELSNFIVHRISVVDIYISWALQTKVSPRETPEVDDRDMSLTSLINLKKMASKYKNAN